MARGVCDDNITARDLFDTKLMGVLTPLPREVRAKFADLYAAGPQKATDWYYTLSQDTDYIRRYRIKKDLRWKTKTDYGDLDITINLSKPEKDPKAIAAAKSAPQSGYPKCQLCPENEGYAGRMNHPARENHRIVPITVAGATGSSSTAPTSTTTSTASSSMPPIPPMVIDKSAFAKLLDFVTLFPPLLCGLQRRPAHRRRLDPEPRALPGRPLRLPHGALAGGEGADLRRVRGCQGRHRQVAHERHPAGRPRQGTGWWSWPIRSSPLGAAIPTRRPLSSPRPTACPTAPSPPIARRRGSDYELDLVLRNNITTEEHPLGVYHPHAELHHIKKENIGLIEVMGLAVLPARLKGELAALEEAILAGAPLTGELEKHAPWVEELKTRYTFTAENTTAILREEVGQVFAKVLEHAGVYARTPEGQAAFQRFVDYVNAR